MSVPAQAGAPGLPRATSRRWQPLRAGLVDLYYYDDQQFWFADGRLLLRGNNGAGKSKVLALMLPFLLDGETAGHRLEPDGDGAKTMEWNLLLGGDFPNPERTGYSWLEWGRRDESGRQHTRTIGFGVKAVRGRGVVKRWFFHTDARVGVDLHLMDASRTALTAERLAAALEGRGSVVDTARAHRALVDETFFGLGEARYGALVDLLIQLRQPQLSRRPSEARLSAALTSALPPLDAAVLSDVAETFRSLEEDRATLARAVSAHAGARDFLGSYRRYARIAARIAAEPPRTTQSRYERLGRDLAEARRALDAAQAAHDAATRSLDAARRDVAVLAQRLRALEQDPRHRSITAIDDARAAAERAAGELRAARARAVEAARRLDAARGAAERAQAEQAAAAAATTDVLARAVAAAAGAGLSGPGDLVRGSALDLDAPPADVRAWRSAGQDALARRRRELARVTALDEQARAAAARAAAAAAEVDRLEAEAGAASERVGQARRAREEAAGAHVAALAAWLDALAELPSEPTFDPAQLHADVAAWTQTLDGPTPALAFVAAARSARDRDLAEQRAAVRARATETDERRRALREELDRLLAGGHLPPMPLPTRDADARAGRPGAPLWRVVDVREGALDDARRAGLEAALEGAGLLDAWVSPDGSLTSVRDDVLLRALPVKQRPASSLADVLVPDVPVPDVPVPDVPDLDEPDPDVPGPHVHDHGGVGAQEGMAEAVAAVLASIALAPTPDAAPDPDPADPAADPAAEPDPAPASIPAVIMHVRTGDAPAEAVWVAPDGRFGTPVAVGSWHKDTAEHLGASARERARAARIAAVRTELADADQLAYDLSDAADALTARSRALAAEASALPGTVALVQASSTLTARLEAVEALRPRREAAAQAAVTAAHAARVASDALAEAAGDVALPVDAAAREVVAAAVQGYEVALSGLWPAVERLARAVAQRVERADAATQEAEASQAAHADVTRRESEAAALAERLATLERTAGVEASALLAELADVREGAAAADAAVAVAQDAVGVALEARGSAQGRASGLEGQLTDAAAARDAAVDRLRTFAATGLLGVAAAEVDVPDPAQPWASGPAVHLARRLEAELGDVDVDEAAFSRARDRVTEGQRALDDVLTLDGHHAVLYLRDAGIVVDVTFRGRSTTIVELEAALADDVRQREELLDAREREVIETYLVEEVASTLSELIADAEAQVAAMNRELQARPTSTGMRLRLTWQPREDGPPGLAAARTRLLRQHADAWSPADREAVGAFLTEQIRAVRADDPGGAWLDQLTRALDHREWHRFTIQRWQNGQWRPATGPASGGERVLAASVPLFAAASAHYGSAPNPHAPRLITLDEAFAGVDDSARADYLGLLAAFDLDVVMTSEREWGCYPQVPGLGICQLSRVEGVDAVLVTPWRWDGVTRERLDPLPPTAAPARPPREEGEQDSLWGDA